ncbi:MAG: phage virion morphogenesis protein [Spirochaetaceae bacterium]|jgi:phage virion morphogenesis protein|nr:phage virion morphogenesis protein [Spirochaetaceae bacterium]
MAGVGIEVQYDRAEFQKILSALKRAAKPDLLALSRFMGEELELISNEAFENEVDPVSGEKWEALKAPRADGTTHPILQYRNHLHDSREHADSSEGTIFGTNLVYGAIHQEGGTTRAHEIRPVNGKALKFGGRFTKKVNHPGSKIPPRLYMGVPKDFDRRILNDPAVKKLLGIPE